MKQIAHMTKKEFEKDVLPLINFINYQGTGYYSGATKESLRVILREEEAPDEYFYDLDGKHSEVLADIVVDLEPDKLDEVYLLMSTIDDDISDMWEQFDEENSLPYDVRQLIDFIDFGYKAWVIEQANEEAKYENISIKVNKEDKDRLISLLEYSDINIEFL